MKLPRIRRRWVVLVAVLILVLATLRLLFQPLTLESYRVLDPLTLVVLGHGAPGAWTSVSNVSETEATVTISVDTFTFRPPVPGTAVGAPLEVGVQLEAPLTGRTVVDGSTGQAVPQATE